MDMDFSERSPRSDPTDRVLADLSDLTAAQVSDLSHQEPAWRHTVERATIPYALALVPPRHVLTPTVHRLASDTARRYGIAPAGS